MKKRLLPLLLVCLLLSACSPKERVDWLPEQYAEQTVSWFSYTVADGALSQVVLTVRDAGGLYTTLDYREDVLTAAPAADDSLCSSISELSA